MKLDFSIGDYIVDLSGISRIVDIKQGSSIKGKEETYIYYEPVSETDRKFTGSIPLNNLKIAGVRKILTKKEIKEIVDNLKKRNGGGEEYNPVKAKEDIYSNDPRNIALIFKNYWKNLETINKTDRELILDALEHFCKEISFVTKEKYLTVRKEIVSILNKVNQVSLSF